MSNRNGVIINVYEESRILRSNQNTDRIKRIVPNKLSSRPHVWKTRGYDRRAQLLAYARELRHADAQWPLKNSRRKPKKFGHKRKWKVAVEKIKRLFGRFDGTKKKWKYEAIVTDECSDDEGSCKQERMKRKTSKGRRKSHFHFCRKLKCLLKKICTAWKWKRD